MGFVCFPRVLVIKGDDVAFDDDGLYLSELEFVEETFFYT